MLDNRIISNKHNNPDNDRSKEDLIQVYKDQGQVGNFGLNFGINSLIPIINIDLRKSKGKGTIKLKRKIP